MQLQTTWKTSKPGDHRFKPPERVANKNISVVLPATDKTDEPEPENDRFKPTEKLLIQEIAGHLAKRI